MRLFGVASACASATLVNAIATGKGAAFGLDLRIFSIVKLDPDLGGIEGKIQGSRESPKLVEICVKKVLQRFGRDDLGARVQTTSNIPIAAGLSSSSAAANATILATSDAIGKRLKPMEALEMGIDAAFEAGVTLTGAMDDAAASMLGTGVATDNRARRIIKEFKIPKNLKVAIFIPPSKIYTSSLAKKNLNPIKNSVEEAHRLVLSGKIWEAMVLNGLAYSFALKQEPGPTLEALRSGVLGSGLTGTGPATVAVGDIDSIVKTLRFWKKRRGRIILTTPAQMGARVEKHEFRP